MLRALSQHCKDRFGRHRKVPANAHQVKHRTPPSRRLWFDSLEERLVLDSTPPVVQELTLFNDTGEAASDGITTDATVTGSVRNSGVNSFLRVEFDWNGDGTVEGVSGTDMYGRFAYRPEGLNAGPVRSAEQCTLRNWYFDVSVRYGGLRQRWHHERSNALWYGDRRRQRARFASGIRSERRWHR